MLDSIRRLFADVAGGRQVVPTTDDHVQHAAAALLFHVVAVDGVVAEEERALLTDLLARRFALTPEEARNLAKEGEATDAEAVDLYAFTSTLKAQLDQRARERIIEMMWRLVYADGTVHEFEDNAVWRVAELLAVPNETRIALKRAVRRGH